MENIKENRMGTMPVKKLLISMSLPIMISMLVQALYNIVDSIFVGQFSNAAFTAVSLAFPIQMLMIAVAVGTGVGMNSLLSRRLGEKKFGDAGKAASNGIFLAVLSWIVFAVFGIFFSRFFFDSFTAGLADGPQIAQMGTQYISICCIFSLGVFMQIACERIMQATGITIYNMIVQITGAV
ncbi:MAG: MATE family efflux transporter, partial [Christensenellaceae bacterium]